MILSVLSRIPTCYLLICLVNYRPIVLIFHIRIRFGSGIHNGIKLLDPCYVARTLSQRQRTGVGHFPGPGHAQDRVRTCARRGISKCPDFW